ncbi:MAG: aldose 1-epimerase family protein [Ruminococcaceae bacterium]|nr:aldose 1-epimerase family protein [Oscillospiraceae bacterium]
MIYTLKNDFLKVEIADMGAELMSVRSKDGCEYLWQGDDRYWASRAPWMFPVCGRLPGGRYTHDGKEYELPNHGFARRSLFALTAQSEEALTLTLNADEQTRAQYPFDFSFSVTYTLKDDQILIKLSVQNTGDCVLPFAFGAHPGFCAPLEGIGSFSDSYLEFAEAHVPNKILFTENLLINGKRTPYPMRDGRFIDLDRDFFAEDATFLANTCGRVTLRSRKSDRFVTVEYPEFSYVGIWTKTDADADYVCIEPWCGLPDLDGDPHEICDRADLTHLQPNEVKSASLCITFG